MQQEASVKPYRRRIVYIHREYQRSFILKFCMVALGAMFVSGIVLYFLSRDTITATYQFHHLALRTTAEAILRPLFFTNGVVLLCFLAATVYMTIYVSHKIGGPLWHFGRSLKSIGEGDLRIQINLRKKDQLKELAAQINEMTQGLRGRVCEVQEQVVRLRDSANAPDADERLLRADIERLHQTLFELFKTE